MNSVEIFIEQAKNTIDELFQKYEEDPYMLSKTHHYICHQLPIILENSLQTRQENTARIQKMTNEQDQFINTFFTNCRYYYLPSSEKYFFYDGVHYQETVEDNVLYNILTKISQEKNPILMAWKHKTKVSILKRIKDHSLIKTIPESETIQNVINAIYPAIFSSRTEAKYFLTVLGDNILKKNTSLIHFVNPHAKSFLREINNVCQQWFNTQCTLTFKTKCHEKHYESDNVHCRLLRIQETIKTDNIWVDTISQISLDLLCVACHYSLRYESSDNYVLEMANDVELHKRVFKIKKSTPESLIRQFAKEYLFVVMTQSNQTIQNIMPNNVSTSYVSTPGGVYGGSMSSIGSNFMSSVGSITQESLPHTNTNNSNVRITWKNMYYLWKLYLHYNGLPLNIFQSSLKPILTQVVFPNQYRAEEDVFIGVDSLKLPTIQKFHQFWNEMMVTDEEESDLEIEEINSLFRIWTQQNGRHSLNESQILDIITYYYPEVEIEKNKYVQKTRCLLWDKGMDIQLAIEEKKKMDGGSDSNTITDSYLFYCKYFSGDKKKKNLLVNKSYFEKYVVEHNL